MERLLDAAFGTDRHGRTAYRVRAGLQPIPDLSRSAWMAGALVGVLQSWPVALTAPDGTAAPLVLVGPVAVDPAHQNQGIGRDMMAGLLARVDAADPLVLIGDPEYYGRHFGFSAEPTAGWELPGPFERRRLLVRGDVRRLPCHGMLGPRG